MAEMPFSEGLALLEQRTKPVVAAIWAVLALSLATALGNMLNFVGFIDFNSVELSPLSTAVMIVYFCNYATFAISIVLVSLWIYRAHDNLRAAGVADLKFTPGGSVGWFFIPIMNLFKPFQAMKELWNESHGTSNGYGEQSPSTVATWWTLWIARNILDILSARMTMAGNEASASLALVLNAIGGTFVAGAAWFLLTIVREILDAQRNHLQVQEAFA